MRSGKKYIIIKFKFLILNQILNLSYQNWQNELACCMRQTRHPVRLVTALGVLILWSVVKKYIFASERIFPEFPTDIIHGGGDLGLGLI